MPTTEAHDLPERLFDFAMTPRFAEILAELRDQAESEDWSYHSAHTDAEERDMPILHSYIRYTYARLAEESRVLTERKILVSEDEESACFNTGLVTENQEEIFALFVKNNMSDKPYWHFRRFCRAGEHDLSRLPRLPGMASYYENAADLVYDVQKELRVNYEHIIEDNKERFPEPFKSMDNYAVQNVLRGAIDGSLVRVKRNYKTAIPQYHQGSIQLLLPLCLTSARRADLALVIANYGEFYRAATCLTLEMAYNNARLLARPDRDWLQP
jgi:hypothetical protein